MLSEFVLYRESQINHTIDAYRATFNVVRKRDRM
jgi:hypothetical protein